jgi:predicted nucleic acid-binding protein
MPAAAFVDTNILLYAISNRPEEQSKTDIAREILRKTHWGWSAQVAGEFFANAVSPKRKFRLTPKEAASFVETWLAFPMAPLTADIVIEAMAIHQRFQLSYWDAAIIAAARSLACDVIYSEDLGDNIDYGGVTVVNPFVAYKS